MVNLIDNAIVNSGMRSTLKSACGVKTGMPILEVSDNGAGIPACAIPHVFERSSAPTKRAVAPTAELDCLSIVKESGTGSRRETVLPARKRGSCFRRNLHWRLLPEVAEPTTGPGS